MKTTFTRASSKNETHICWFFLKVRKYFKKLSQFFCVCEILFYGPNWNTIFIISPRFRYIQNFSWQVDICSRKLIQGALAFNYWELNLKTGLEKSWWPSLKIERAAEHRKFRSATNDDNRNIAAVMFADLCAIFFSTRSLFGSIQALVLSIAFDWHSQFLGPRSLSGMTVPRSTLGRSLHCFKVVEFFPWSVELQQPVASLLALAPVLLY